MRFGYERRVSEQKSIVGLPVGGPNLDDRLWATDSHNLAQNKLIVHQVLKRVAGIDMFDGAVSEWKGLTLDIEDQVDGCSIRDINAKEALALVAPAAEFDPR